MIPAQRLKRLKWFRQEKKNLRIQFNKYPSISEGFLHRKQ